jgi:hypothetical protein
LAKPNYQFEKRQRDLAKKSKQEEKRRQKLAGKGMGDDAGLDGTAKTSETSLPNADSATVTLPGTKATPEA